MSIIYLLFILLFFNDLQGGECESEYIEIDEICYYKRHIDVLQDFIDFNIPLNDQNILEIGYQEWTNNQLTYFYLGNSNIEVIPDSIGILKELTELDLQNNNISFLPEGICDIYPFYTSLNLTNNKICPPYPYCFEYLSNQNTSNCDELKCPKGYMEIDDNCYYEEHIQILQSLINVNPSLTELNPLEIAKEIGYQGWENGKLIHLNLISNGLITIPESLCSIYKELKYFDISNNEICPPYPSCFEFIGYQNNLNCDSTKNYNKVQKHNIYVDNRSVKNYYDINKINIEHFRDDIAVLQKLIDNNENLKKKNPLEIGIQKWEDMRLTYLDLSNNEIVNLPKQICDIYPNLSFLDLSNNKICPPYPECIEYINNQTNEMCVDNICTDKYINIDNDCYYSNHINFLEDLIDSNTTLRINENPFEALKVGSQTWKNGKMIKLILTGLELNTMPESICTIYNDLTVIDISNNMLCPPYPYCIENTGYQNTKECSFSNNLFDCPENHISFDKKCYHYNDINVLIEISKINKNLNNFHPLLLGYQLWQNGRLTHLNLDGWNISSLPNNINKLNQLNYLNLNNNQLELLPDSFCEIYYNFNNFQIDNNKICPPYLDCFDFIGNQNTQNCEHHFCPYNNIEINEQCYNEYDISVLQDFIDNNESLTGKKPLDIGVQKWKNMKLDYLYLGINNLTVVPESICKMIPQLTTLNISQNSICPPYPNCIETFLGKQNTNSCP